MIKNIESSTRLSFKENAFFQELPQNLQLKVVKVVLKEHIETFSYFFEDFRGGNKAHMSFVAGVVTSLDYAIYKPGEVIVPAFQPVDSLVMIQSGSCNLNGFNEKQNHLIVKLPSKSWYGEMQILLNLNSTFEL